MSWSTMRGLDPDAWRRGTPTSWGEGGLPGGSNKRALMSGWAEAKGVWEEVSVGDHTQESQSVQVFGVRLGREKG